MDFNLQKTGPEVPLQEFEQLQQCMNSALSLHELVVLWLEGDRAISFMTFDEESEPVIGVSFESGKQGIAIGVFDRSYVVTNSFEGNQIPKDIDADNLDRWFNSRNDRLGIELNETLDSFTAPVEAFEELIMVYAMYKNALSRVALIEEQGNRYYELFLVVFDSSGDPDWGETILISASDLTDHVRQRIEQ